jgi:hypothetical protein
MYFLMPYPSSSAKGLPMIPLGAANESIKLTDLEVSHSHKSITFYWTILRVSKSPHLSFSRVARIHSLMHCSATYLSA